MKSFFCQALIGEVVAISRLGNSVEKRGEIIPRPTTLRMGVVVQERNTGDRKRLVSDGEDISIGEKGWSVQNTYETKWGVKRSRAGVCGMYRKRTGGTMGMVTKGRIIMFRREKVRKKERDNV